MESASTEQLRRDLIESLSRSDAATLEARADRILWQAPFTLSVSALWQGLELPIFLEEARTCFVNGEYVAAVMLANAFAEHAFVQALVAQEGKAKFGHGKNIQLAKDIGLFPADILRRAWELNALRNAYSHTNQDGSDYTGSLSARFVETPVHPSTIMEADAQHAIWLIYDLLPHVLS